jgi:hypothetical protein
MDINGLAINTSIMGGFLQQPQQASQMTQQPANENAQQGLNQAINSIQDAQNGDQAAAEQGKGLNLNLKI